MCHGSLLPEGRGSPRLASRSAPFCSRCNFWRRKSLVWAAAKCRSAEASLIVKSSPPQKSLLRDRAFLSQKGQCQSQQRLRKEWRRARAHVLTVFPCANLRNNPDGPKRIHGARRRNDQRTRIAPGDQRCARSTIRRAGQYANRRLRFRLCSTCCERPTTRLRKDLWPLKFRCLETFPLP